LKDIAWERIGFGVAERIQSIVQSIRSEILENYSDQMPDNHNNFENSSTLIPACLMIARSVPRSSSL
jgi:hypothetical protein